MKRIEGQIHLILVEAEGYGKAPEKSTVFAMKLGQDFDRGAQKVGQGELVRSDDAAAGGPD